MKEQMNMVIKGAVLSLFLLLFAGASAQMTIHVINVGQGNCVFVEGPKVDGKRRTLIFDGGKSERSYEIVDYLTRLGYMPDKTVIDYMVVSHKDADHFEGFMGLLSAGYDIDTFYHSGSDKVQKDYDTEFIPQVKKLARKLYVMKPGYSINMGNRALITCMVSGGQLIGGEVIEDLSENDKSIGLLFEYGDFEFFSAGDLGGGKFAADEKCTNRSTSQKNIESSLLRAMQRERFIERDKGIEVLHVSHHGSESSTNYEFMNGMSPTVAVISVGQNQSTTYQHPRIDIVERVLMAQAPCITAPPALVLQTEEGLDKGKTSFEGLVVGDIIIEVDASGDYKISTTGEFEGTSTDSVPPGLWGEFKKD